MSSPGNGLKTTTVERIERFVDAQRFEHDVPGLSLAVTDPDGVVYARGFGARDIESRAPATPETLYSIASVTKVYTALAVLRLATRGDLSVNDEIRQHTDFWNDVPGDPITVAELLTHTSGVPEDHGHEREVLFSDAPPASPIVTAEDTKLHTNVAAQRRMTDPPHMMYSSRGYQILGVMVRNVSGRPFAEFVDEELFDPMGMERTQVGYDDLLEIEGDVATGYAFEEGEPVPSGHDLNAAIHPPHAAGGILSSAREMAATARCLLNEGAVDGTQLIDPTLVNELFTVHPPALETVDGVPYGAGYGPRVTEFLGEPLAYHTGTAPDVSRAYLGVLRDAGYGVTIGVNSSDVPIGGIGHGVHAILLGEEPVDVVPQLGLREKCESVAGRYVGFRGAGEVLVRPAPSASHIELAFGADSDTTRPAFPTSTAPDDRSFYLVGGVGAKYPVTFHETADGMELRFNTIRAERVPVRG